jgi:hypothetical protein
MVQVRKEELNKNGVTYRGAGGFTIKANPSVKGTTRYIVVKGNKKVGAISYRLKRAATQAARKVGGTVKIVISGAAKRNGFWRERLADKVQGKKVKKLRQVAREKIAERIRGKKKNAETRDAAHPIHVRQYWQGRKGYKSQWQRAHEAGQRQLFSVKNPLSAAEAKQLRDELFYLRGKGAKRTAAEKKRQAAIFKAILRYEKYQQVKNPGTTAAKAAYKEFTGKPSRKVISMYAPKGSGARGTLAAMGKLKKIYVKGRHALDFKGGVNAPTLARDPKTNQMFVLGKQYKLNLPRRNPTGMEDLGEITKLEYEAQKVHLGDTQTVTYFHRMGEEGGKKPHCLVNSEGLIVISGGDYTIGAEGIRN